MSQSGESRRLERSGGLDQLAFTPQLPRDYRPQIGLIGCGGITVEHLRAYRQAGFTVVAMCDLVKQRAERRAAEFFPKATCFTDYRKLLDDPSIEVVDITTHPEQRSQIIRDAMLSGKHVLSQKPFVTDLTEGQRLVELAVQQKVRLAVNQNGRWAPHYRFARSAIQAGLLGDVFSVHMSGHWDHTWVRGTPFELIRHLILYDYAIHWFDLVRYFFEDRPVKRVYASTARVPGQDLSPHLLAQVILELNDAQASLVFDAGVVLGQADHTFIAGTKGSLNSSGPSIQSQRVELNLPGGCWSPTLTGSWFPDGFLGSMAELLCAIEETREPENSARDNLKSLQLCFAAIASADRGEPVIPGAIHQLPHIEATTVQ
jgi:predicted dehydrogenase